MPIDFKQSYDAELADWERHRSAATTPIGFATLIGGVFGFAVQKFDYHSDGPTIAFIALAAVVVVALAVAGYELVKQINGHSYKRMPTPEALLQHLSVVRAAYLSAGRTESEADLAVDAQLAESYAKAATVNMAVNLDRSEHLFRANRALVYGALAAFLCLPLLAWNSHLAKTKPVQVEVVNLPSTSQATPRATQ